MGYSLGSTVLVAFGLAKQLGTNGDEVLFWGALDSPPYIYPLVEHLSWTAVAAHVTYFLGLIAQDDIPLYEEKLEGLPHLAWGEVVERLLDMLQPEQLIKEAKCQSRATYGYYQWHQNSFGEYMYCRYMLLTLFFYFEAIFFDLCVLFNLG
jgi:thioesterase domain-containing protein